MVAFSLIFVYSILNTFVSLGSRFYIEIGKLINNYVNREMVMCIFINIKSIRNKKTQLENTEQLFLSLIKNKQSMNNKVLK